MTLSINRVLLSVGLALVVSCSSGCHHFRQQECTEQCCSSGPLPTPPGAPEVMIIGEAAPRERLPELQILSGEIHKALTNLGGLRLVASANPGCDGPCDADSTRIAGSSPALGIMLPPDGFTETVNESGMAGNGLWPLPPNGDGFRDRLEVRIVIEDFSPYRPMRLAATFTVRNVATGHEYTGLQGTWHGPDRYEPLADADCSLQHSLRHPKPRVVMEADNLASLSPRLFLRAVASEVAPALHSACLSGNCVLIESAP